MFPCSRPSCHGWWLRGDYTRITHFVAGSYCGKYCSFLTALCVLLQNGLVTASGLESVPLGGQPPFSAEAGTAQGSFKVVTSRSGPVEGPSWMPRLSLLSRDLPPSRLVGEVFLAFLQQMRNCSLTVVQKVARGPIGSQLFDSRAALRPPTSDAAL